MNVDNPMTDETKTIKQLHATYCAMTGHNLQFTFNHILFWNVWRSRKWTIDDLRFLIRYLRGKIRRGERNHGCLKFSNLIKDVERFAEDLAMARAETRNAPVRDARSEILAATGRKSVVDTGPITAAIALERTKMAAMLREWKEKNL